MRALRDSLRNWGFAAPVIRGCPVELTLGGETLWIGQMNVDLPPMQMVPELLERAAFEIWSGKQHLRTVGNRTHPNDFSGAPKINGGEWRMMVPVWKEI